MKNLVILIASLSSMPALTLVRKKVRLGQSLVLLCGFFCLSDSLAAGYPLYTPRLPAPGQILSGAVGGGGEVCTLEVLKVGANFRTVRINTRRLGREGISIDVAKILPANDVEVYTDLKSVQKVIEGGFLPSDAPIVIRADGYEDGYDALKVKLQLGRGRSNFMFCFFEKF